MPFPICITTISFFNIYRFLLCLEGLPKILYFVDNYCGGVLTSKVGRIQTPNYPANYSANTNCLWTIEVKDAVKVHLEVEDFEIEPEADCISDRLVIYAPRSFPLYNCGKALKTKTVDGDFFMVEFLSNDKINTKGFSIIYRADFSSEQVEKPTEVPFGTKQCYEILENKDALLPQ